MDGDPDEGEGTRRERGREKESCFRLGVKATPNMSIKVPPFKDFRNRMLERDRDGARNLGFEGTEDRERWKKVKNENARSDEIVRRYQAQIYICHAIV